MVKKILVWGGVAFAIFFIAFNPTSAATVVQEVAGGLVNVAQGIGDFFSELIADT